MYNIIYKLWVHSIVIHNFLRSKVIDNYKRWAVCSVYTISSSFALYIRVCTKISGLTSFIGKKWAQKGCHNFPKPIELSSHTFKLRSFLITKFYQLRICLERKFPNILIRGFDSWSFSAVCSFGLLIKLRLRKKTSNLSINIDHWAVK